MSGSMIGAILILPGTVLVYVPAIIILATEHTTAEADPVGPSSPWFWLGIGLVACGIALAFWSARLFHSLGRGTPAPWDPPRKLVVTGPYRYVRNPMIIGVMLMLGAEALILWSWPIAAWLGVFFLANAIYFPLSEERDLEHRFGTSYRTYKANVPAWLPRFKPWRQSEGEGVLAEQPPR